MSKLFKRVTTALVVFCLLCGCSTNGGMYNKDDYQHSEFSVGHTILGVLGVVGAAAAIAAGVKGGGGGYYEDPKWDYFQSNGQWVCRNAVDGQFLAAEKCAYQPMFDNWPGN